MEDGFGCFVRGKERSCWGASAERELQSERLAELEMERCLFSKDIDVPYKKEV